MKKIFSKKRIEIAIITISIIASIVLIYSYKDRLHFRSPILAISNAKITFAFGKVYYKIENDKAFHKAKVGLVLKNATTIKTEKNSYADLFFSEGTALRIKENSIFELEKYTIEKTKIKLEKGSFIGKFKKLFQKQKITIKTPTTLAAIRGTELGFKVENENDPLKVFTRSYTLSGITEISNPKLKNKTILLSHQKKSIVKANHAPENPVAMTKEEIDNFSIVLNSIHYDTVLLISNKILFKQGSAKLLKNSYAELNKIAKIIIEKNYKIKIEGHTDNVGTAYWNRRLSRIRAMSVKKYLISKGIKSNKLNIAGYGSSKPIASNETIEGKHKNRRVEFLILE